MTLNSKFYDRAATVLGGVLAFIQTTQVNYPALMAGDSAEVAKLIKAVLFAAIGYISNKRPRPDDSTVVSDEIESRFADVERELLGKSNRKPEQVRAAGSAYRGIEPFPGAFPLVLVLALGIGLAGSAGAQSTQVAPEQIKTKTVATPSAVVLLPSTKGYQVALLDPSSFVVDITGPVPVLRVPPPAPTQPGYTEVWNETARPSANSTSYTLQAPAAGATITALRAYRNGVRLTPGIDYTIAGTLVSFMQGQFPEAGDVLTCDYRYQ